MKAKNITIGTYSRDVSRIEQDSHLPSFNYSRDNTQIHKSNRSLKQDVKLPSFNPPHVDDF